MRAPVPTSVILTACLLLPQLASAQPDPPVGVRAAGMGGAFVAVADDASAVYWNPGGLAAAAYLSLVADRNTVSTADDATAPRDGSGLLFALGTPPLGLTYYRTSRTEMIDIGPTMARVQRLVTNQAGATLVQSIGGVVAIGATLKFVRGSASATTVPSGAELDVVDGAVDRGSNAFDADVGVMVTHSAFKAGVAVRNLFEPSFELADGSGAIPLERRIRAGVSWRLTEYLRLAADSDLTTAETGSTRWRDAAIGAETHVPGGGPVLRGGIHWNTAGGNLGSAPVGSVGASYPVYRSILADGQASFGSRHGDRGWGVGVRVLF